MPSGYTKQQSEPSGVGGGDGEEGGVASNRWSVGVWGVWMRGRNAYVGPGSVELVKLTGVDRERRYDNPPNPLVWGRNR